MKQIIYNPVHLTHLLTHYFYYDDVQKLVDRALSFDDVESVDFFIEETVNNEESLRQRQVEAICYALGQGFTELCKKHLF